MSHLYILSRFVLIISAIAFFSCEDSSKNSQKESKAEQFNSQTMDRSEELIANAF